jgi:hydroxymethylbilane synthase
LRENIPALKDQIRIGTRGSALAIWQARHAQARLEGAGMAADIKVIKTKGDEIQHLSFDKIEGKGFFTREIEEALSRGEIDLAVHSMKDLPTASPDGLAITAVSYRADPADWLLLRAEAARPGMPLRLAEGARVGTSSARRKALMRDLRPDARFVDIRGNVPTRLEKLRRGECDALLLAAAGLSRLELPLDDLVVVKLDPREFVPAPAQGVLAYQARRGDTELRQSLRMVLHHPEVSALANLERKTLQLLGGGCHMPLGVYARRDENGYYHLWGTYAERWDAPLRRANLSSSTSYQMAEQLARMLAANPA